MIIFTINTYNFKICEYYFLKNKLIWITYVFMPITDIRYRINNIIRPFNLQSKSHELVRLIVSAWRNWKDGRHVLKETRAQDPRQHFSATNLAQQIRISSRNGRCTPPICIVEYYSNEDAKLLIVLTWTRHHFRSYHHFLLSHWLSVIIGFIFIIFSLASSIVALA